MNKTDLLHLCSYTFAVTTGCFSFIPEKFFSEMLSWTIIPEYWNDTVNKILFLMAIGILTFIVMLIWKGCRNSLSINNNNYKIVVEYGDILDTQKGKKVINFDECYTTDLGDAPHQIKRTSLCGQFLEKYPNIDINSLIAHSGKTPKRKHSKFNNKECYESGSIIPNGNFLLMAFGKLNTDGRAVMSREEFLESLSVLWKEIDKYYAQSDILIPVLGSGITRFEGEMLTQQQLVDIIIASYQISPYKIKKPNTLHIVCKKRDGFSLNNIGQTL